MSMHLWSITHGDITCTDLEIGDTVQYTETKPLNLFLKYKAIFQSVRIPFARPGVTIVKPRIETLFELSLTTASSLLMGQLHERSQT
jgi:hypothetical protein